VIGEVNHTYFSDLTSCLCRSNFVVKAHLCNECHLGHGLYAQECMMMRRFVISKVHPDMQSMDKSDCPTKVQVQSLKRDSENFSSGDVSQCCLFICTSVCVICHGTYIDSIYYYVPAYIFMSILSTQPAYIFLKHRSYVYTLKVTASVDGDTYTRTATQSNMSAYAYLLQRT
jgi:hypothetical protein